MDSATKILNTLKTQGHRLTKVRKIVLAILCEAGTPLSAAELIEGLKKHQLHVNKTTVYRELEFLLSQHVIREVDLLEGKKRYEIFMESDHHHHMICTKCKTVCCVDMAHDLDVLEKEIMDTYGFQVTDHTLEFFGVCQKCR